MPGSFSSIEQLLRGVPLFTGLEETALSVIASQCRRRTFAPRTSLFHQDDPGSTLYIVVSGYVNIQTIGSDGEPVHIARHGPGEPIGELSLLDGQGRSADAVTGTETCDVIMLDRDAFLRLIDSHPALARNIIASLASRLRGATAGMTSRQTRDVMGRLAAYLLTECEVQAGAAAAEGTGGTLRLRANHSEIATLIGARRETVSRALSRLRSSGEIRDNEDGSLTVNRRRLKRLRDGA